MNQKSLRTDDDVNGVMDRYADMIYKVALSQTKNTANAEDIFQEVFLRYLRSSQSFESEEHRKAWLIRVTVNCSKKLWSSAWFRHTVPLEESIPFAEKEDSDLFSAVSRLPIKYRLVIHLYYYEDLSARQISYALRIKESTVTSRLCRARALLRKLLKGEYGYETTI